MPLHSGFTPSLRTFYKWRKARFYPALQKILLNGWAVAVFVVTVVVAAVLPAQKALGLDPLRALRHE